MAKTKIEWCDYTVNPVKGKCPMACPYCYARRLYDRFHWDATVRYEPEVMYVLPSIPDGSRVFWGSTIELFHESIPKYVLMQIFEACRIQDNLTHIFLTKQPEKLLNWSPFPDNCWIGVSITNRIQAHNANFYLPIIEASVKFISFEPLLDDVMAALYCWNTIRAANWVIIGQQTPPTKQTSPRLQWVAKIISTADTASIPVFLKDNMKGILPPEVPTFYTLAEPWNDIDPKLVLRQEFPQATKIPQIGSTVEAVV